MSITIDSDTFNEIMLVTGYPIITTSDLNLTEEQIKQLLIWPAMRIYFNFFPKRIENQYTVGTSTFSIDFPRATTFGVLDARLSTARFSGLGVTNNPFINAQNIAVSGGRRIGKYGTENNYDFNLVRILERSERQSIIDSRKAFKVRVNETDRTLSGYSNITGKLAVIWADYSEDWDDIVFSKIEDVKKLAQANILEYFGTLRGQQNSDVPNSFNYDLFLDKARDLKDEVMEKFKAYSKVILLRT